MGHLEELDPLFHLLLYAGTQAFNDAVLGYNNTAENFPNNVIANTFNFELASFLEIESEEKRDVPEVSFT